MHKELLMLLMSSYNSSRELLLNSHMKGIHSKMGNRKHSLLDKALLYHMNLHHYNIQKLDYSGDDVGVGIGVFVGAGVGVGVGVGDDVVYVKYNLGLTLSDVIAGGIVRGPLPDRRLAGVLDAENRTGCCCRA
jgi:hypothetical protein